MFRATGALSAMLMTVAFACTFDPSGSLPGVPSADSGADVPVPDDSTGAGGSTVTGGDPDAGADAATDGEMDDMGTGGSGGGSNTDGPTDAAADSVVRPNDGDPLPDGAGWTDAGAAADGSEPDADARGDCTTLGYGVAFVPPGATTPHCYWLHGAASNWLGAANTCAVSRGHLVTLSSNAETTFVLGLVTNFPSTDRIWVGGTDGRFSSDGPGSGPYVWITGEPFAYTNWYGDGARQEPNGVCDSCNGSPCYCEHRMAIMNDGRWDDAYEAVSYRFVCEAE